MKCGYFSGALRLKNRADSAIGPTYTLGISYNTLSYWRQKKKKYGQEANVGSGNKRKPMSEQEQLIQRLQKENSELKRANDILQEALGFFAASRKR